MLPLGLAQRQGIMAGNTAYCDALHLVDRKQTERIRADILIYPPKHTPVTQLFFHKFPQLLNSPTPLAGSQALDV